MTAHLIISIDSSLAVIGVSVWSGSPLHVTRRFRDGRFADTVATLYESQEADFGRGEADCWEFYERYCDPALVARFPPRRPEAT